MRPSKNKRYVIAAILLCLLAAAGISKPVRSTLKAVLTKMTSPSPQTGPDVEQRARTQHGWDRRTLLNSVMRGTLTYYDRGGIAVQRVGMTLYRKYPDQVRLEIERAGGQEISGFDGRLAWRGGAAELRDTDAREIRAWARMWPERLFVDRGNHENYREVGRFIDERAKASVTGGLQETDEPVVADQVEVEDNVGLAPANNPRNGADWRRMSFYIDSETALVYTARWLEPNNPSQGVNDENVSLMDVRVDFRRYTQVDGMIWPFEIIHRYGGRTDFRVEVSDMQFNQKLPDTLFQNPN